MAHEEAAAQEEAKGEEAGGGGARGGEGQRPRPPLRQIRWEGKRQPAAGGS